jgi:hypothetical protein
MTRVLDFGIGPAQALLLRAALDPDREAAAGALAEWWRGIASFDDVQGTDSGLFAQVHANLGNHVADQRLRSRLKGAARHVWLRNQYMIADCARLVAALAEAGVPAVLLKGAAMVVAVDRSIGLRWMTDCDILVPPAAALTAVRVLAAGGFTQDQALTPRDLTLVHGLTLHDQGSGRDRIDLHWQPIRDIGAPSLTEALIAAARPADIGGAACLVPAPEHMVFHAVVHGTDWSPQPRYDWLVDTVKIVRAAGSGFDWDALAGTARTYRFGFLVGEALAEVDRHFPGLVPAGVAAELRHRRSAFERREAHIRKAAPAERTLTDEMLLAAFRQCRASDAALRRPLLRTAPAVVRSLYGPLPDATRPAPGGDLAVAFLHGWSAPQTGGRWTDGHLASLALTHPPGPPPAALSLAVRTVSAPTLGPQTVGVFAGLRHLGDLDWPADGTGPTARTIALPAKAWRRGTMVLRFTIGRPVAPVTISLNPDPRALGILLESVRAVPATADLSSEALRLDASGALPYLWHGWSSPEPIGTWTFGRLALLRWRTPVAVPAGHRLLVSLGARAPGGGVLSGRFAIEDRVITRFAYPATAALATTVVLPLPKAYRAGETISLAIAVDNPVSVAELTGAGDPRPVGLLVEELRIVAG